MYLSCYLNYIAMKLDIKFFIFGSFKTINQACKLNIKTTTQLTDFKLILLFSVTGDV